MDRAQGTATQPHFDRPPTDSKLGKLPTRYHAMLPLGKHGDRRIHRLRPVFTVI
jgi:hypothetical protein